MHSVLNRSLEIKYSILSSQSSQFNDRRQTIAVQCEKYYQSREKRTRKRHGGFREEILLTMKLGR